MVEKNVFELAEGVVIEAVGDDLVVMVPGSQNMVFLAGPPAAALRAIQAGEPFDSKDDLTQELITHGILVQPKGMSRRSVLTAGAVGTVAGIAALAVPSVAAASSTLDPILLDGEWVYDASVEEWTLTGQFDLASEAGGATDPGPLTIDGVSFAFVELNDDSEPRWEGDGLVDVEFYESQYDGLVPVGSATFDGTFTVAGQPYIVTFVDGDD